MKSNLIAIGSGLLAVTALGLLGMDRLNREPRPGATTAPVQVAAATPATAPGLTTIHYQMDPDLPPLPAPPPPPNEASKTSAKSETKSAAKEDPPILPPETPAPPLLSTGELEKKLKSSLDKLQKALPTLPSAEESGLPEPGKTTLGDKAPPLPTAPDRDAKLPETVIPSLPPVPTAAQGSAQPSFPPPPGGLVDDKKRFVDIAPPSNQPPFPSVPAAPTVDKKPPTEAAPPLPPSAPPLPVNDKKLDGSVNKAPSAPPLPAASNIDPTTPPVPLTSTAPPLPPVPPVGGASVPPPPIGGITVPNPQTFKDTPTKEATAPPFPPVPTPGSGNVRNVSAIVVSTDDFQKRLIDLELKYLQGTSEELSRRLGQLPENSADRRRVVAEQQRVAERIRRLQRAAELAAAQHIDDAGKTISGDSPWTMHLETADGKTVLQAVVHRKARFKIVCDRLDLQSPRGTVLAVGHVNISGEGFQGTCDRLSIPLHEDRLILEGGAEVGVRTQTMAIIEGNREGQPPIVEPRRLDEQTTSPTPILHLKGDHLDLRWSDLQPGPLPSARADEPIDAKVDSKAIRGTPGPMVKVAFNSSANEKWSEWGTLRRSKSDQAEYMIADAAGLPVAFVSTPAGLSLAEYVGKRVSVFGIPDRTVRSNSRGDGRPVPTFTASHVAWE